METSFVLLIYENQLFAEGLEYILQHGKYKVLKKAISDFKDTTSCNSINPEILIIEGNWLSSQLENAIDKAIRFFDRNVKIILVTNFINKNIFCLVSDNKIQGIVLKVNSADEFLFGIKQVLEGNTFFSSQVTNVFVKNKMENKNLSISRREKQILNLIAEMNSTAEIANKLFISESTVKTHRRNLMSKLHSKTTFCLIRNACSENLLNRESHFCGCCFKQFIEV